MNTLTRTHLDNLRSENRELQNSAFTTILQVTAQPADGQHKPLARSLQTQAEGRIRI